MPLVEISLWPGRTDEAKERMIEEVTEAVVRTSGAPPEAVTVILTITAAPSASPSRIAARACPVRASHPQASATRRITAVSIPCSIRLVSARTK